VFAIFTECTFKHSCPIEKREKQRERERERERERIPVHNYLAGKCIIALPFPCNCSQIV